MGYITEYYRKWLLDKVMIECWTTKKCAEYLGRSLEQVNRDLKKFLDEVKIG
jgi:hypothetical protein